MVNPSATNRPNCGKMWAFIYGNDSTTKNNVNSFFGGFPEYGMSNPFNFSWEITLIATPKGCKNGTFIHGIDANANTVSNLPLGLPLFRMTNACNFRLGISPASNPQNSVKTGAFTHGNDSNAKTSVNYFDGFP